MISYIENKNKNYGSRTIMENGMMPSKLEETDLHDVINTWKHERRGDYDDEHKYLHCCHAREEQFR